MAYTITVTNETSSRITVYINSSSGTSQKISALSSATISCDSLWASLGLKTVTDKVNCTTSETGTYTIITPSADNASCSIASRGPGPEPPSWQNINIWWYLDGTLELEGGTIGTSDVLPVIYTIDKIGNSVYVVINTRLEPILAQHTYSNEIESVTGTVIDESPIAYSVCIYAISAPSGYTITYQTNGGTAVPQATGQTNLPNPLPTTTKSGNRFDGWYTDSTFHTAAIAGAAISADTTLYAKWVQQVIIDISTLSGWGSLASGDHSITLKAKATGYRTSEASNAITVNKPAALYTLNVVSDGRQTRNNYNGCYIKVGQPPTSSSDYDTECGCNQIVSGETSFNNVSKVYMWYWIGGGTSIPSYSINGGEYVNLSSNDWQSPTELTLTSNTTLAIYTLAADVG